MIDIPRRKKYEEDYKFAQRVTDHDAFMTRVKLTRLSKKFSNKDKFPYDADDLAVYMYHHLEMLDSLDESELD